MNQNVRRYRMLRQVLQEHQLYEMFFANRPICSIEHTIFVRGINLQDRADIARQGIDRARFLAKNDRSDYLPHVGEKQIAKELRRK